MRNRVAERFFPTELIELRAAAESKPLHTPPAKKRPNWGLDMIAFLRAEAPVDRRALGLRRPVAPKPSQSALAMASSAALRTVVGVYDVVVAAVEALLTELAALAPLVAQNEVAAR